MRIIKRWLNQALGFSQAQASGFIVLFPLILLIIFSNSIYRAFQPAPKIQTQAQQRYLDSLVMAWEQATKDSLKQPLTNTQLFAFNPNTASKEQLLKLGFPTPLALRLIHYRDKGGKFKKRSDLMKLYGIDSALYSTLYSYMHIPSETEKNQKTSFPQQQLKSTVVTYKKLPATFDLNQADTIQLKSIYGIGSKLAARIIKYRSALGGFISTHQLYEVWGLDSVVIERVTKSSFIDAGYIPTPLFINQATEKELATHPYLSKTIAKGIVAYRFQHGKFESPADLEKVQTLEKKTIQKIAPYLNFQ